MSINDIPKDKDYIDNGFDSTIHTDNMYLYKSYFAHITKEVLEDYHTIHTYLSQFEREFDLPKIKPYIYNNNRIKKVIFDIIPLNHDIIYEAVAVKDTYLNNLNNRKKGDKHLITYPNKIEGINLLHYSANNTEFDICYAIKNNIIQRLTIFFPYIELEGLSLQNIMVTKVVGHTIYCTITDLGNQIKHFVKNQREMGIFHKIALGGIKKHKSDKTIVRWKDGGELV